MSQTNNQNIDISSEIIETIIGEQTKFKGNVKTPKPIRIDGDFEGEIDSTSTVIITETGTFKGTVSCKNLFNFGKCEGQATCTEIIDIKSGALFRGDVIAKNIVTHIGTIFDGTSKMLSQG